MAGPAGPAQSPLGGFDGQIGCGVKSGVCVMRNIMIFAAVLVGLGTFMAQLADRLTPTPASATPSVRAATMDSAAASQRTLSIPTDRRGHFRADGRIDGQ